MRYRITLSSDQTQTIPINYQYELSRLVNRTIKNGNPRLSRFIHGGGISFNRRQYRAFTFSRLWIPNRQILNNRILIMPGEIKFVFSTPSLMIRDALYDGLLKRGPFRVGSAGFRVTAVEDRAQPYFGHRARFTTLSPVALSKKKDFRRPLSGKNVKQTYLRPGDSFFNSFLKKSLENKYIAHRVARGEPLSKFKKPFYRSLIDHINIRGSPRPKLITIKEGTRQSYRVPCALFEIELTGSPAIIEFAYDAGIGKHTSLGFGCLDTLSC